jgi:hypothetical protein
LRRSLLLTGLRLREERRGRSLAADCGVAGVSAAA